MQTNIVQTEVLTLYTMVNLKKIIQQ